MATGRSRITSTSSLQALHVMSGARGAVKLGESRASEESHASVPPTSCRDADEQVSNGDDVAAHFVREAS